MKMVSVGVVLFLGICLTILAVACEEGEEKATATAIASPTASPAASPSPTPEVAACPDDDPAFCTFAAQVEQAIVDEDADFFVANSLAQSILCTAEAADVGYLCGPEQIGETVSGVPYGRESSEGTLMPPDDYRSLWLQVFASELPAEEDTDGSGELRIWALAYPILPAEGTPRNIVLTYISDTGLGPERQAISLHCGLVDGQWQVKSVLQHILALVSPKVTSVVWHDWPQ
jgi:hypothetical protein